MHRHGTTGIGGASVERFSEASSHEDDSGTRNILERCARCAKFTAAESLPQKLQRNMVIDDASGAPGNGPALSSSSCAVDILRLWSYVDIPSLHRATSTCGRPATGINMCAQMFRSSVHV
jgi:hypothetical protein